MEIVEPEDGKTLRDGFIKVSYKKKTERWNEIIKHKDRPPELIPYEFSYYVVSNRRSSGTTTIGLITEYTTPARVRSLIYRFYNPGHAQQLQLYAHVEMLGDLNKRTVDRNNETLCIVIPPKFVRGHNLWVDDEFSITITRADGRSWTDKGHLSNSSYHVRETSGAPSDLLNDDVNSRSLVVPLVSFKRLVCYTDLNGIDHIEYVPKTVYNEHTELLSEGKPITITKTHKPRPTKANPDPEPVSNEYVCYRFIEKGMEVHLDLFPSEYSENSFTDRLGRFDFVKETLKHIQRARSNLPHFVVGHPVKKGDLPQDPEDD